MSFILDALRRAEAERRSAPDPDASSPALLRPAAEPLRRRLLADGARPGAPGRHATRLGWLAALVALDESYLQGAGVPPEAIRAVVLLDAYGLDIARHVRETGDPVYARVFGPDPAGWTAMSPVSHAAMGRPPPPVILHLAAGNPETEGQAEALAGALRAAGGVAEVHEAEGESHNSLNYGFGAEGDATTRLTLDFLAAQVR